MAAKFPQSGGSFQPGLLLGTLQTQGRNGKNSQKQLQFLCKGKEDECRRPGERQGSTQGVQRQSGPYCKGSFRCCQ